MTHPHYKQTILSTAILLLLFVVCTKTQDIYTHEKQGRFKNILEIQTFHSNEMMVA